MLIAVGTLSRKGHFRLFFSAARMRLVVDRHHLIDADLGVLLRGREGGVAEEFLDGAQVGAAIEQVGGEGVAQGVRGDVLEDAGLQQPRFEVALDAARRQPAAAMIDKERLLVAGLCRAPRDSAPSASRALPPTGTIRSLRPLPSTRTSALAQIDAADIQPGQLADAQTAGIEQSRGSPGRAGPAWSPPWPRSIRAMASSTDSVFGR